MLPGCWNCVTDANVTWVLELCDRCKCYLGVGTVRQIKVYLGAGTL